jgi:hypothetical protein
MYEDSNLKIDCQIHEDWKNRLSCNHYIKCFCFNRNVANKNTNISHTHKCTITIPRFTNDRECNIGILYVVVRVSCHSSILYGYPRFETLPSKVGAILRDL